MNVGVVGLGAMGAPIAINLHKAGVLRAIWNRTSGRAGQVTQLTGIETSANLPELARVCDVIILSVSADRDVIEVVNELMPGCRPETILVDTSTISAATAIYVAGLLEKKSLHYLDAPVSGGVEGAQKGVLSMMVGGDESVLNRVRPLLEAIATRVIHLGPIGNGQATKAVNQIMAAGINQAVTEALAFAKAMELPMEKVVEVVGGGAAGNWFLTHRGAGMVKGQYEPGFRVVLHDKDLDICEAMAKEKGMKLPVVSMTRRDYRKLIKNGFGDEDISCLYRLKNQK